VTGPRLSIIPARAATDRSLKPRDLQVLCVLGRHTDELGWCRKSQVKMADEMGCARSTVFEAVERLVKAGYVERYVQEEASGRDSPHVYRVILDPPHPNPGVIPVDLEGEDPADQPAPPAGISAPPAGPGPAPKNDPLRTIEKERGREDEGQKADDPAKYERRVKKVGADTNWPGWANTSTAWTVTQFAKLTDAERAEGEAKAPAYVAFCKGKAVPLGVYFRDKKWTDLPASALEPKTAVASKPPDYAPPFGPAWSAWVIATLAGGPENAEGATEAERWPKIAHLFSEARFGRGFRFAERWHSPDVTRLMVAVPVGTEAFAEWVVEFQLRGCPALPDPGQQRVVYFPAGGPARLSDFEDAVRGKHNDGNGQEAAE